MARWCERVRRRPRQALELSASYIPFASLSCLRAERGAAHPAAPAPGPHLPHRGRRTGRGAQQDRAPRARTAPTARAGRGPGRHGRIHEVGPARIRTGLGHRHRASPYRSPSSGVPRVAVAVRVRDADRFVVAELSLADADAPPARARVERSRPSWSTRAGGPSRRAPVRSPETSAGSSGPGEARRTGRRERARARWCGAYLASYAPVRSARAGASCSSSPRRWPFARPIESVATRCSGRCAALGIALLLGTFVARTLDPTCRPTSRPPPARSRKGAMTSASSGAGPTSWAGWATAFNHMAREVQRRDEEIRRWNGELQRRVQERTTELRDAQDQIARARRLAAMGSLGAGVAHGLNNPLTSRARSRRAGAPRRRRVAPSELLDTALAEGRRRSCASSTT